LKEKKTSKLHQQFSYLSLNTDATSVASSLLPDNALHLTVQSVVGHDMVTG